MLRRARTSRCDLNPELAPVAGYKRSNGVYASNAGISLVDMGDGIGVLRISFEDE